MSVVLVDTSVWIDDLRGGEASAPLQRVLEGGYVFLHPWCLYELGLGGVSEAQWDLLARLPRPDRPDDDAIWRFALRYGLRQSGIGWVDLAVLASAHASGMALWTLDARLESAARSVGLAKLRLP